MLLAIQKSYELLANYGFFAREICDKCGIVLGAVRFTQHNASECTALVNAGVMLTGLRPTGREGRANTRLSANAEQQEHAASRFIGRIPTWKKLSVFNQKQRTCRRKKCLSRTCVLRELENRSVRAKERKWRALQNSRCTLFRPSVLSLRGQ
jgi:hypothetical protein